MRARPTIAADELGELYVDRRLTIEQISQRLGSAPTTIRRLMAELSITRRPRGPVPGARRVGSRRPHEKPEWAPELAWAVGLLTADGNLSGNGRSLSITSKDIDLLETARSCLDLTTPISRVANGRGQLYHRLQWTDRLFYLWLLGIGLMPAKSLRLGSLRLPDECFPDFLRGCIDGDGSVTVYIDLYHAAKNHRYVYDRLYVKLVSASQPFLEWVQSTTYRLLGITGTITVSTAWRRHPLWRLCYAKRESMELLRWIYYAPTVPCLARKRAKAEPFLKPLGHIRKRPVGRPRVGWLYDSAGCTIPITASRSAERKRAGVEKLVDSPRSKRGARKGVGVQIPSPAPLGSPPGHRLS